MHEACLPKDPPVCWSVIHYCSSIMKQHHTADRAFLYTSHIHLPWQCLVSHLSGRDAGRATLLGSHHICCKGTVFCRLSDRHREQYLPQARRPFCDNYVFHCLKRCGFVIMATPRLYRTATRGPLERSGSARTPAINTAAVL